MMRDHGQRLACGIGVALAAGGTALPWVRTGNRERSSYELAAVADRLLLDAAAGSAARAWLAYPLFASVAGAALLMWSGRAVVIAAAVVPVLAGLFAVAVATQAPVTIGAGPAVTMTGAALAVIAALLAVVVPGGQTVPAAPSPGGTGTANPAPAPPSDPTTPRSTDL